MRNALFFVVSVATLYSVPQPEGENERIILLFVFFLSIFNLLISGISHVLKSFVSYRRKINLTIFFGSWGSFLISLQSILVYLGLFKQNLKVLNLFGLLVLVLAIFIISFLYNKEIEEGGIKSREI
jgi:hypothetical protein